MLRLQEDISKPVSEEQNERLKNKAILKPIQDQEDTSSSNVPGYLLLWNYCVSVATFVKEGLQTAPEFLFPDSNNPGNNAILPEVAFAQWPSLILRILGPMALIYQWKNTYDLIKRFNQTNNKNWERYKEVTVSVLSSLAWTVVSVFIYIASVAALPVLLKAAAYILAGVFLLNATNGLINTFTHLYYAITAKNALLRKEYLWRAAKSFISIFTNTLGFVTNLFLGIKVNEAMEFMMSDFPNNVLAGLSNLGQAFVSGCSYLFGLTMSVTAGIATATLDYNRETWQAIRNPGKTLHETWEKVCSNPLTIIPMTINFALRTTSLLLAPIQIIGVTITNGLSWIYNKVKKKEVAKEASDNLSSPMEPILSRTQQPPAVVTEVKNDAAFKREIIAKAHSKINKLTQQLGKYDKHFLDSNDDKFTALPNLVKRRIAKRDLLARSLNVVLEKIPQEEKASIESVSTPRSLLQKEESLAAIEMDVRSHYRDVYCNFWSRKGAVEEIMDELKSIGVKHR